MTSIEDAKALMCPFFRRKCLADKCMMWNPENDSSKGSCNIDDYYISNS